MVVGVGVGYGGARGYRDVAASGEGVWSVCSVLWEKKGMFEKYEMKNPVLHTEMNKSEL